ncbi:MAG: tRNA (N6-isopentenyl adenosine(37)-C2)-methylthiotransferase MiaB [Anaerolineaceae bacterium 4572_78]|nr:MAG: tRNA (N6-isopentenyl adenosine(37)-C2)-methylthiotransferase MiaB [Anaerolineaceae bacterium 4572_78]
MNKTYNLWTSGCQMNISDSQRVGSELEKLGYRYIDSHREADVVVINTCVVRQSAEDRATGFIWWLKPLKKDNPHKIFALMGCLVGVKGNDQLKKTFPHIDVLMPPSNPMPLINYILNKEEAWLASKSIEKRYALQDGDLILPLHEQYNLIATHVPIVYGCSYMCSYCVIPYRRGIERSRPVDEIVFEVRSLVKQGVKEVTLLGQIVDRYGYDISDEVRLADLLQKVHDIDGLERIRFLTSHPNYMTDAILHAVAYLPKVCQHIEIPIQSGDDEILKQMRRNYTADDYRRLIHRIREYLPNSNIATDVIVGFPGETVEQFQRTIDVLESLKMDVCHVAMYSPRPNTVSAKTMPDDVPAKEKKRRLDVVNQLQQEIVAEINKGYEGQTVEVLVEEKHNGKWKGRTRTNKLVFFEDEHDFKGQLVKVRIEWAGPWSMRGLVCPSEL